MRVLADSHAIYWYLEGSHQLSDRAHQILTAAEADEGIVVSVITLIDLWYVTQTTKALSPTQLTELRRQLVSSSPSLTVHPVDLDVEAAYRAISREELRDPWDRFIVATARALELPLITRDATIATARLADVVW